MPTDPAAQAEDFDGLAPEEDAEVRLGACMKAVVYR